jgi:hypothetical protein
MLILIPLIVSETEISEFRYVYDTVLFTQSTKSLENLLTSVKKHREDHNLFLKIQKTKILSTDKPKQQPEIAIQNENIENASCYEYLGALINNRGDGLKEIRKRLAIAL